MYVSQWKCNLCFGRRGSDSSIETKSGTVLLGVSGGAAAAGGGGGGGGEGEEGEADEEVACHSLPLQVNYSSLHGFKLCWPANISMGCSSAYIYLQEREAKLL